MYFLTGWNSNYWKRAPVAAENHGIASKVCHLTLSLSFHIGRENWSTVPISIVYYNNIVTSFLIVYLQSSSTTCLCHRLLSDPWPFCIQSFPLLQPAVTKPILPPFYTSGSSWKKRKKSFISWKLIGTLLYTLLLVVGEAHLFSSAL